MITAVKIFYNLLCSLEGGVLITSTSFGETINIGNAFKKLFALQLGHFLLLFILRKLLVCGPEI